ncbi:DUF7523 family protein [Halorussus lipolyticus]|uniref:DUF7523 family protein n=1 Tax=Halorussus lipolyticus TaxID=3034024 RepID=UPI0023E77B5C|nr:hypothetical protein [Halorussus sp. DT80]
MSLSEETREEVRRRPFLLTALRAGVVNYTAAARSLADEIEGDPDSIATALRRFAESLPDYQPESRSARVSMRSGLGVVERDDATAEALLTVGDTALAPGEGSLTAVVVSGEVDGDALVHLLGRLRAAEIEVRTAAFAGDSLVVAVERRDGPDAVRIAEDASEAVPNAGTE